MTEKEWVSLTDEEIIDLWPGLIIPECLGSFVEAIEELLKEKNS